MFPVSSSLANNKILENKHAVAGLVFKINAIDSKKSKVCFYAMNSATLNTMKGTVGAALKTIAQPFKTVQFQA